jgi:hypothetical protein
MKAINIIIMEWMKCRGTIEYKIKSSIGFGLQPSRQRGLMMEMMEMRQFDDEDDAQTFKDPSPFSSYVVVMVELFAVAAMEAVERQARRGSGYGVVSLPWLLPSLNRLLAAGFKFSRLFAPNMPLGLHK